METQIPQTAPTVDRTTAMAIAHRVATPLFLFSALLALSLWLSWTFLIPRFTVVEVNGQRRNPEEMEKHRTELVTEITRSETIREKHVLSVYDPQYQYLQSLRRAPAPLSVVWEELAKRVRAATDNEKTIQIRAVSYDLQGKTLRIRGDVRNVGTRSMTVLAAFVDTLQKSEMFASVTPPRFTREDDSNIGPHSPFDLQISLR